MYTLTDNYFYLLHDSIPKGKVYIADIPLDRSLEFALDNFTAFINRRGLGRGKNACKIKVKREGDFRNVKYVYTGEQPACAPDPSKLNTILAKVYARGYKVFKSILVDDDKFRFMKDRYEADKYSLYDNSLLKNRLQELGYVVVENPDDADYLLVRDMLNMGIYDTASKTYFLPPLSLRDQFLATGSFTGHSIGHALFEGAGFAPFFPNGGLLEIAAFGVGTLLGLSGEVDAMYGFRRDYYMYDVKNNKVLFDMMVARYTYPYRSVDKLKKEAKEYSNGADEIFAGFLDYMSR